MGPPSSDQRKLKRPPGSADQLIADLSILSGQRAVLGCVGREFVECEGEILRSLCSRNSPRDHQSTRARCRGSFLSAQLRRCLHLATACR